MFCSVPYIKPAYSLPVCQKQKTPLSVQWCGCSAEKRAGIRRACRGAQWWSSAPGSSQSWGSGNTHTGEGSSAQARVLPRPARQPARARARLMEREEHVTSQRLSALHVSCLMSRREVSWFVSLILYTWKKIPKITMTTDFWKFLKIHESQNEFSTDKQKRLHYNNVFVSIHVSCENNFSHYYTIL